MKRLSLFIAVAIMFFLLADSVKAQDFCEGNFDCDADVDGTDAFVFKDDFGRSSISDPCPITADCCYSTLSPLGRWCDQNDGTVKDMTTGLIWLKDASWGGLKSWADSTTWDDAHTRAGILHAGMSGSGLSDGSVEGDWRLPTKGELVGITVGEEYIRSSQGYFFTNVQYGYYWSSTAINNYTDFAYAVAMGEGIVANYAKVLAFLVWPVRGGHCLFPSCMEECENELEICLRGCEAWAPDSRYICNDNCVFDYSSNCIPACSEAG